MKTPFCTLVAALVAGLIGHAEAGSACGKSAHLAGAKPDIVDTAVAAGNFTTLVTAVKAAGLVDTLKGDGPFTVFAPTDEAFAKLPAGTLEALLANPERLKAVLLYHVAAGNLTAKDVLGMPAVTTLQGSSAAIGAQPAPSIAGVRITATDIACKNGTIHVIDAVMLPPGDIVEVATSAGSFKTLLAALQAAGLEETLKGAGPFTVFAPTDEAFAKLPAGALDGLLKDPVKLKSVLLYHVVPGKVAAADVVKLKEAPTAGGGKLSIDTTDGVKVNEAKVVKTDVAASNGLIHVIDTVLLPRS